jgi:hypothetical protein
MHRIRIFIICHLVLGPYGVAVIADDAKHPERWGTWYRNPSYAIPFCLAMEGVNVGILIYLWQKERRFAKGLRRLEDALRLQGEGRHAEAERAYHEGLYLTGQK